MPEEVILREFKYFDRQIVEDFLSSMEGGLATESRSSSIAKNRRIGGEVGLPPFAKISAQKGSIDITKEETKTLGDAALFQRLYDALSNHDMIKQQAKLEENKQGDIIELSGDIELPFFETALDFFVQLLPIMQSQTLDQKGLAVFNMLSKSETLNVRIMASPENKIGLVAVLFQKNLRISKQGLADNFTGLYRIKRILKENETYNLLKLPIKLNQKMIDDLLKNFTNMDENTVELLGKKPTADDLQVHYPTIILTPVAIYQ